MVLVIGGYAQGKLDYVRQRWQMEKLVVWDGMLPEKREEVDACVVVNHLHLWIKECLLHKEDPMGKLDEFLEETPDCILISDEIGNGIVPVDAFEREYREKTGRILIVLAKRAEEVERIVCGMAQKIK